MDCALALAHTFTAKQFTRLSHHFPQHAGLLHLLGEVEVVFGFWAIVLVFTMAFMLGGYRTLEYAESRNYREPVTSPAGDWSTTYLCGCASDAEARVCALRRNSTASSANRAARAGSLGTWAP